MTTKQEVDAFKQHRLWEGIDSVIRDVTASAGRSQTDRETLARVLAVSRYVKSFRAVEPYLFPPTRVIVAESLAGTFDTIASQLSGWDRDGAMLAPTVATLDSYCDSALQQITAGGWPSARKGRGADAFAEAADAYRVEADASLAAIAADVEATNQRLADIRAIADKLGEASEARQKEAADALTVIEQTRAVQTENAQESLQQELKRVAVEAEGQRDALGEEAKKYLEGLRDNYETGNELVKKIADQSVGGEYLNFANSEAKAYKNWNVIGTAAVLVAFLYLVVVFSIDKPSVEGSILKLGISLSVLGFSAYAFREAGKRQRQSVEARYRALDVIAMPPFSKDLSEPQRQQLTYIMGERLFGRSLESSTANRKGDAKATSFNFAIDAATIKTIVDTAKAIKDTTP